MFSSLPASASAMAKAALRASLHRASSHRDANDAHDASERMMAMIPATRGDVVALFVALPSELPTEPLAMWLQRRGIQCAVPRIIGNDLSFHIVPANGWSTMMTGPMGILQPPLSWARCPLTTCAWVVVPGLAMGLDGARLGRGRGYYDRCLGDVPPELRCGWIDDDRLLPFLPTDDHDERLGWVVTPKRVLRCR